MEEYLKKLEETFKRGNEICQQKKAERTAEAACLIAEMLNEKLEENDGNIYIRLDVEVDCVKHNDVKVSSGVDVDAVISLLERVGYKVRKNDNKTYIISFE